MQLEVRSYIFCWKRQCHLFLSHCVCSIFADRCSQPKAPGPCVSYMTRWFYNTESGSCETFVYGGCEGNRNKFLTQQECEGECITESSPQTPSPVPATPSPEVKTQDGKTYTFANGLTFSPFKNNMAVVLLHALSA